MNRFGMWFANLMRGRYGTDNLNRFLIIITIALIVLNMFIRSRIINLIVVILLIYTYCRMFSRNINARYRENQKFLRLTSGLRNRGMGNFRQKAAGDDSRRILRCPGCGEKLRVPRGAGKINISCPHCGTKFIKKV